MATLTKIVLVAVLTEAVVDWLKDLVQAKPQVFKVIALLVAASLALVLEVDFFALINEPCAYPIIGEVLTGIIASRGANYVHDLWDRLRIAKNGPPEKGAEEGGEQ